ncbi:hypothetical protein B0T25DRAFT_454417 [Lasiosphaeria hispida]|uniref:Alpha-1,3-mannosyltransferase n=1 Tax=Lasiosphaeria hispida TaxID=260671 RepID=A0AAJ0HIC9_9PEZI|nr:hypothetical protein B0T25DRAFT_454417 [Lasiosphaeria hispida]
MPPPHLHPRSRMTSSLFATTVVASFFVVTLPHILPCPAPRVVYADGEMPDGSTKRRRRRPEVAEAADGIVQFEANSESSEDGTTTKTRIPKRECPVPKPKGMLGELLGFTKDPDHDKKSQPDR